MLCEKEHLPHEEDTPNFPKEVTRTYRCLYQNRMARPTTREVGFIKILMRVEIQIKEYKDDIKSVLFLPRIASITAQKSPKCPE